jgi:hypothetical protein
LEQELLETLRRCYLCFIQVTAACYLLTLLVQILL